MAIVKFINGKNEKKAGLIRAIDYIVDEDKTEVFNTDHSEAEDLLIDKLIEENKGSRAISYITKNGKTTSNLVTGVNCGSESAFDEMLIIKQMYNKESGRQFIHFTHSYSDKEKMSPELAHEISLKLLEDERFKGFQILAATHVDREHIHTHFILNTVNTETGKKWQQSSKEVQELIRYSDQLCTEYGLKHSFANLDKNKTKSNSKSTGEYRAKEKGESWKTEAFHTINDCRKTSTSKDDFIFKLKSLGYKVRWEDSRKNITFTLPNGRKLNNDKLHPADNFTKEALLKKFSLNKQYQDITKKYTLEKQFDAKQEIVLQTVKMLEDNPHEGHKDYPRSYLENKQALKEMMIEKSKGEGLDWDKEKER